MVGGAKVRGGAGFPGNYAIFMGLAAFAFAAAFILGSALLSSCSGGASAAIGKDGAARISLEARIPGPMAGKLRSLTGLPAGTPFFDTKTAAKDAAARGMKLVSASTPDPDSLSATIEVADLEALAARPDIAASGAFTMRKSATWTDVRVRLEHGKVAPLVALFPGLDADLVDSLSPPALDPDPLTKAEYRRSLLRPLGEAAVTALDSAKVSIKLEAPGPIVASSGGTVSGSAFTASFPVLDLLCLEKPIEFSLRWAR